MGASCGTIPAASGAEATSVIVASAAVGAVSDGGTDASLEVLVSSHSVRLSAR